MFAIKNRLGVKQSARALIFDGSRILLMHRKRFSRRSGKWVEYYSIPGGMIDEGESAERAVVRELYEEMTAQITVIQEVAYMKTMFFEHFVFTASVPAGFAPVLAPDSEEALYYMSEQNQFIPEWVDVTALTAENLRYYKNYLPLIQRIALGEIPETIQDVS